MKKRRLAIMKVPIHNAPGTSYYCMKCPSCSIGGSTAAQRHNALTCLTCLLFLSNLSINQSTDGITGKLGPVETGSASLAHDYLCSSRRSSPQSDYDPGGITNSSNVLLSSPDYENIDDILRSLDPSASPS